MISTTLRVPVSAKHLNSLSSSSAKSSSAGCITGSMIGGTTQTVTCTENAELCSQGRELSSPRLGIETGQRDLHIVEPRSFAKLHSLVVCALQSARIGLPRPENGPLFRSCEILRVHNLHWVSEDAGGVEFFLRHRVRLGFLCRHCSRFSCGILPATGQPGAVSVPYAYPAPDGVADAKASPSEAFYSPRFGEFIFPYEAMRTAADPENALLAFLQSTYEAAATLGQWDRKSLEGPQGRLGTPPSR